MARASACSSDTSRSGWRQGVSSQKWWQPLEDRLRVSWSAIQSGRGDETGPRPGRARWGKLTLLVNEDKWALKPLTRVSSLKLSVLCEDVTRGCPKTLTGDEGPERHLLSSLYDTPPYSTDGRIRGN